MPGASMTLGQAIKLLKKQHGPPAPPPTADPFELVLWENVAYLAAPERRREAFEELRAAIGTRPIDILRAKQDVLERVTARGILKGTSAAKLRECARVALEKFDGDLGAAIRRPLPEAKRALQSFPSIGEPGAEKILLWVGRAPLLAPDSNALRVLVRLGLVREDKSYARCYAASREAAKALPATQSAMREAHLLLQLHGRRVCKRSAPSCARCLLASGCAYARRAG